MKKLALVIALALSPVALAQIPGVKLPDAKAEADKAAKKAEKDAKKDADKAAKDAAKEVKADAKAALKADVVETALLNGKFTKLAAALQAAGMVEELKKPGPFTVFAPTDEAFGKIPAADLTALLADKAKLTKVLQGHVVAGKVMAKDVKTMKAKTLGGAEVDVTAKDGKVTFGGAAVTQADIDCTNGVIHVIDTVVMPK